MSNLNFKDERLVGEPQYAFYFRLRLALNLGHNPLYRHFCMYQHIELFKNQCDVSIQPL